MADFGDAKYILGIPGMPPIEDEVELILRSFGYRNRSQEMTEEHHDAPMRNYGLGFEQELTKLINKYNIDSSLDTPDFVIAGAMRRMLPLLSGFVAQRDRWWGFVPEIGNPHVEGYVNKGADPNYFSDCNTFNEVLARFGEYVKQFDTMTVQGVVKVNSDAHQRLCEIQAQTIQESGYTRG